MPTVCLMPESTPCTFVIPESYFSAALLHELCYSCGQEHQDALMEHRGSNKRLLKAMHKLPAEAVKEMLLSMLKHGLSSRDPVVCAPPSYHYIQEECDRWSDRMPLCKDSEYGQEKP
jgi:hypothetical protein